MVRFRYFECQIALVSHEGWPSGFDPTRCWTYSRHKFAKQILANKFVLC